MNNSAKSRLAPGTVVSGKYRILRRIGAGGMGEVYEAVHLDIDRPVALKLLQPQHTENQSAVKRFQREARLAGSLGHDNICEVTDFGWTEDGAPYFVMPLLRGEPLSQILRQGLRPSRLLDIACQTLAALEHAHAAGIVHRDLKPDNIFVTRVGDRLDFVKLLDFGISKMAADASVSLQTRTGTVLGTPHYMSPEQAQGERDVDGRTDIYAMGVILYEGLTGRLPYTGDSYNQLMFRIVAGAFTPPPRAAAVSPGRARADRHQGHVEVPLEPLSELRRHARGHRGRPAWLRGRGAAGAWSGVDHQERHQLVRSGRKSDRR